MAPVSSKEFLDIQATIEWRFTLKRDTIITYSRFGAFINWVDFLPFSVSVVNFEQVNAGCVNVCIDVATKGVLEKKPFLKVAVSWKTIF